MELVHFLLQELLLVRTAQEATIAQEVVIKWSVLKGSFLHNVHKPVFLVALVTILKEQQQTVAIVGRVIIVKWNHCPQERLLQLKRHVLPAPIYLLHAVQHYQIVYSVLLVNIQPV